jgi:hypothetical protein
MTTNAIARKQRAQDLHPGLLLPLEAAAIVIAPSPVRAWRGPVQFPDQAGRDLVTPSRNDNSGRNPTSLRIILMSPNSNRRRNSTAIHSRRISGGAQALPVRANASAATLREWTDAALLKFQR